MKLPPMKSLPVFEAVARLNSFSRAADELSISQSAVSHQIRMLEGHLGELLFTRQGRYLSLTEEGRRYFDAIGSALFQIERASEQIQGRPGSQLRLALFSSFAVRWLVPNLPTLQHQHPELDLVLEMMNESPQLSDRVADCFVTIHKEPLGYTADLLYSEQLFAICSRPVWQKICHQLEQDGLWREGEGQPFEPGWLKGHTLLSTYSIFGTTGEDWRRWFAAGGERLAPETRVQHFSHMLLALEAARYHQGIALTNDYMHNVDDDPDLVRLPCHTLTTGDCFYFAFKTSRRHEPGIATLRQWIRQQAVISGLLPGNSKPQ